jgi:hypothetical protein
MDYPGIEPRKKSATFIYYKSHMDYPGIEPSKKSATFIYYKSHMDYPGIEPNKKPTTNALSYDMNCLITGLLDDQ